MEETFLGLKVTTKIPNLNLLNSNQILGEVFDYRNRQVNNGKDFDSQYILCHPSDKF